MPILPPEVLAVLMPFASLFTAPTFRHLTFLLVGAILTPGPRTVTACLRAVGLSDYQHFQNLHRTLNRARWSPRQGARGLLTLLAQTLVPGANGALCVSDNERSVWWGSQGEANIAFPIRIVHIF